MIVKLWCIRNSSDKTILDDSTYYFNNYDGRCFLTLIKVFDSRKSEKGKLQCEPDDQQFKFKKIRVNGSNVSIAKWSKLPRFFYFVFCLFVFGLFSFCFVFLFFFFDFRTRFIRLKKLNSGEQRALYITLLSSSHKKNAEVRESEWSRKHKILVNLSVLIANSCHFITTYCWHLIFLVSSYYVGDLCYWIQIWGSLTTFTTFQLRSHS